MDNLSERDSKEIVRLGEEAMGKPIDALTDDDFEALMDFADFSMAIAKSAHRHDHDEKKRNEKNWNCAAMSYALNAVNAYRRVIGLEAHESEVVIKF